MHILIKSTVLLLPTALLYNCLITTISRILLGKPRVNLFVGERPYNILAEIWIYSVNSVANSELPSKVYSKNFDNINLLTDDILISIGWHLLYNIYKYVRYVSIVIIDNACQNIQVCGQDKNLMHLIIL